MSARTIPLTQGKVAMVDEADYEMLRRFTWRYHRAGYALTGSRHAVLMHRVIMLPDPGVEVDHINRDGLDNRRSNLRLCCRSENARNQKLRTNTQGRYRGVALHRPSGLWGAKLMVHGRTYSGGYYESREHAARAYDVLAVQHHGDFATLNFPKEQSA